MLELDFFEGLQCNVTETHIDEGQPNAPHRCPIAISLNHALDTFLQNKDVSDKYGVAAHVGRGVIDVRVRRINQPYIHAKSYSLSISEAIQAWILNFDHSHDEPLPNNTMAHDPQPITVCIQGDMLQKATT